MDRKTDRRAALKLLTAAPVGLAVSALLVQEASAQISHGTADVRAAIGPVEPGAGD